MLHRSAVDLIKPDNPAILPQEELAQNEIINFDKFEAPHYNLKYYETVPMASSS